MDKIKLDETKLTPEQRDKLDAYNHNKKQLEKLQDITDITQDLSFQFDQLIKNKDLKDIGTLLTNMNESLDAIKNKEDTEIPDVAKPINDAFNKLETSLGLAIKQLSKQPEIIVNAPPVNVKVPDVDLKGIEKIIKQDIPQAFREAIAQIPTPTEKPDRWDEVLKWLEDIDTATRMKPVPGSMKVTTVAGGSVADVNLKQSNTILFAKVDTASSGDTSIVAAVASKKIKLLSCKLIASGAVSIKWRSGTTDLEGANSLVANSGYVLPASSPGQGHYLETAVNTALNINLSGAVQVSGHITYYTEA